LYTTAATYPWYQTLKPLALPLPPPEASPTGSSTSVGAATAAVVRPVVQTATQVQFRYRYVIQRAGTFYRWESSTDAPQVESSSSTSGGGDVDADVTMGEADASTPTESSTATFISQDDTTLQSCHHYVPLRLLIDRESYVVNNVLGGCFMVANHPVDMEHIRVPGFHNFNNNSSSNTVSTLHSRDNSGSTADINYSSYGSLASKGSASALAREAARRHKSVNFAPSPPPYHMNTSGNNHNKSSHTTTTSTKGRHQEGFQPVHLTSSDGLVVVSAFLPVILHRSTDNANANSPAVWTADWDYEVLLSMQTHLRVTRVGVVKWRGWHGHSGTSGSPEMGVPIRERSLVEQCLRPFSCVPVWIDPTLFGEM
jgi:hypothetical protein